MWAGHTHRQFSRMIVFHSVLETFIKQLICLRHRGYKDEWPWFLTSRCLQSSGGDIFALIAAIIWELLWVRCYASVVSITCYNPEK